jgi:hypothetical protein
MIPYPPGTAQLQAVDSMLADRDTFLAEVRTRLLQAQEYARCYYDAHHRPLEFAVGDWVWVQRLHRPTQSLSTGTRGKLGPRYAEPFQVLERIGEVAYRLRLPADARVHDVFHVGVLKPFRGEPPSTTPPLPPLLHGRVLPAPERVLRASLRRGVWHVLVQWEGLSSTEATWEPVDAFRREHPSFQLEDELFIEGGEMLWWARYTRGGTKVAAKVQEQSRRSPAHSVS